MSWWLTGVVDLPALLCSGVTSAAAPPQTVLAYVGGVALLPCSYDVAASSDIPTVEWSKPGLRPDVIFLYRDGCETFDMKHPDFTYRTGLVMKELKTGNISLRISDIRLSDAGTYKCLRIWKNTSQEFTNVQLVVGELAQLLLNTLHFLEP